LIKITIITSQAWSLINFRGPLIRAFIEKGFCVYTLAPDFSDETRLKISEMGAIPVDVSISRTGSNPFKDLLDIFKLMRLMRWLKSDIILAYFIKPIIYGLIAARTVGVSKAFALIEGLGSSFSPHDNSGMRGIKKFFVREVVIFLYRAALKRCKRVFFLNDDDADMFRSLGVVKNAQIKRIDGIGLDLSYYSPEPVVLSPITFIMVARMLREKGVLDFIDAIRIIKKKHISVRFILLGGVDSNPDSISKDELLGWEVEGLVEWPGNVKDVRIWLAQSSVFVLPSYYREGIPRSSQEAMAMARPIITTDWTGCRDTVEHGKNGFLVPIKNPVALADAMEKFICCPDLIDSMGRAGRLIAESRFNVKKINAIIIDSICQ